MPTGSRHHFKMQITSLNSRGPGIQSQMSHRLSVFTKVSAGTALDVECPPAYLSPGLDGNRLLCEEAKVELSEDAGLVNKLGSEPI